jgi:maltose-binding protein MalE
VNSFQNGEAMCVIVSSNVRNSLSGEYEFTAVPALASDIPIRPMARITTMVVNAYSEQATQANEFAQFVALEQTEALGQFDSGVALQQELAQTQTDQIAYEIFEDSVVKPNSMKAEAFLEQLQADFLDHTKLFGSLE